MEALILAAGLGSRLRPLTSDTPKAMVKYQGKEIISYQIEALDSVGIKKIHIVSGYFSSKLEEFLKAKYKDLVQITRNELFESTNSAFSFMTAVKGITSESYIHINCDILFSEDLLKRILNSEHSNVIATREDVEFSNSMENVISINGRIVNMSHRHTELVACKGFGLAKISREAMEENIACYKRLIPEVQMQENYYGLIRMSLGKYDYYIFEANKSELAEINTLEDYDNCKFSP